MGRQHDSDGGGGGDGARCTNVLGHGLLPWMHWKEEGSIAVFTMGISWWWSDDFAPVVRLSGGSR
jgi:hypothetical protein